MPLMVLLVCTGNTCRSAMGEALFRQELARRGLTESITVGSAGTLANPGDLASPGAMVVLAERNVDLTAHRARPLTRDLIDGADVILTMTSRHRDAVVRLVPAATPRVHLLREYAGLGDADVVDPFGGGPDVYRECADDLMTIIPAAIDRLSGALPPKERTE